MSDNQWYKLVMEIKFGASEASRTFAYSLDVEHLKEETRKYCEEVGLPAETEWYENSDGEIWAGDGDLRSSHKFRIVPIKGREAVE